MDFKEIIQKIMAENGVRLSPDDPLMICHIMNEHLIKQTADSMEAAYNHHLESLEELLSRHGLENEERSKKIISGMINAQKKILGESLAESEKILMKKNFDVMKSVMSEADKHMTIIKTSIYIIAACSIFNGLLFFLFFQRF